MQLTESERVRRRWVTHPAPEQTGPQILCLSIHSCSRPLQPQHIQQFSADWTKGEGRLVSLSLGQKHRKTLEPFEIPPCHRLNVYMLYSALVYLMGFCFTVKMIWPLKGHANDEWLQMLAALFELDFASLLLCVWCLHSPSAVFYSVQSVTGVRPRPGLPRKRHFNLERLSELKKYTNVSVPDLLRLRQDIQCHFHLRTPSGSVSMVSISC